VTERFPVMEVFGPTVQGEGPDAGRPALFVRFGGCDYRCDWCDTLYAVDPDQVRETSTRMTCAEIRGELARLEPGPRLVVLTGGNPALLQLGDLVDGLHADGFDVAVETQGSVWRDWLALVDRLVVSPKPPSSGMTSPEHAVATTAFLERAGEAATLKIVVFDEADLDFAEELALAHPRLPVHLSAGTDQNLDDAEMIARLRGRLRWLYEAASRRRAFGTARISPQLHVLAWGSARGV
jgi:7-carboxy-7-deazaguanine synthase